MPTVENRAVDPVRAQHVHGVQLYGNDESSLAARVGLYIAEGLDRGEGVIVIATPSHIAAFMRRLQMAAVDGDRAILEQRLIVLDAQNTLDAFSVGGSIDERLFDTVIRRALSTVRGPGGARRAYGEMVGILWQNGDRAAAIHLEQLWNNLLPQAGLELFCGYPIDILDGDIPISDVERILSTHTHLLPTDENRDLERALERAVDDVGLFKSDMRHTHTRACESTTMPAAERTVLAFRSAADTAVVDRARTYYQIEKRFVH